MTCVSSPRRASSHRNPLALLLGGLLLLAGPALVGAQTTGKGAQTTLEFAAGSAPSVQERAWLEEDRSWIRSDDRKSALSPATGLLSGDPRTRATLGRWLAAVAPDDSSFTVRTVASLIRDRWIDRGFLQARVQSADSAGSTQLRVRPGPRYRYRQIAVGGNDFAGRQQLLDLWLPRPDSPFQTQEMQRAVDRILRGAGENGYPFVRWVTSSVQLDTVQARVDIQATLLPGRRAVIGPVTSDLPPGRPSAFLAKATGIKQGELFRESELERAVDRLLARDLYATVGSPTVYPTTSVDTVGLHFPVTPRRKVNRLQVVLGLSRRQEDEPSRLSGEVDLRLPNLAGSGRNLGINWRDDGGGKSRFGFDYLEPLAFGTPLDMLLGLDSEVQEDAFTRFRLDNRWQLSVVALWGLELGVGWDRSTYPTGTLESSSRTRARGAFLHRRGDPTRSGWAASFALENAWRSSRYRSAEGEDTLAGSQLGQALSQRIYEIDTSGEVWLSRNWSLAGRAAFRQLDSDEELVPLGEQFRFGGAATLRGYREDEFHGSEAAWGSLELRVGPPLGSRLYTFYDLGYFGFSSQETGLDGSQRIIEKQGWPRGYGLGILARTPGGDISLAVGFPGTVDFEVAKLHVTLLESF